jgi:two-component system, NtrC family, nitrogen regulation sensor histidine kinase NtrY
MARMSRIRRRLTIAVVVTAVIPVGFALWVTPKMIRDTSERFYIPEVGKRLDRSLDLYNELVRSVKATMKSEASAMAADAALAQAVASGDAGAMKRELTRLFAKHRDLVSLSVRNGGRVLASVDRGRPLDPSKENRMEVVRSLAGGAPAATPRPRPSRPDESDEAPPPSLDDDLSEGPELLAVFAADKALFDEHSAAVEFVSGYHHIEERRESDQSAFFRMLAVLLGFTILAAVGVGLLLARTVSRRVVGLERATRQVAAGDLSVRVPEAGTDEISALARAFNRMLAEVEQSRSRIEYLQRISAWQEMARRLAHEIKNPLTPIQLAVQDIHRRYDGTQPAFRKLLDTTLEVVEDEVGTLRRLVGEFSDFARLPHAELERADLAGFLRDLAEKPLLADDERRSDPDAPVGDSIEVSFDIPPGGAFVEMDRQMLRRVLINLVRNAMQAIARAGSSGRVVVRLGTDGGTLVLDVEDSGPGIPDDMREAIFDPYVTTRTDGTGLGLAIVKKIVVEHGGSIAASRSSLGGAKIRIRLPPVP